jgi:hypothetical protein
MLKKNQLPGISGNRNLYLMHPIEMDEILEEKPLFQPKKTIYGSKSTFYSYILPNSYQYLKHGPAT